MYYINENVVTFYKESFVEGFVYHGSPNGDIKVFEPRESTQKGAYVYATDKIEIAGVFGFKMSSIEKSLSFCGDNTLIVTERVQGYFKSHDHPVYIYKLDGRSFDYFDENSWGKHEVRSPEKVVPLEIIKFDSALEMLKQFEQEGKIKLFLYPNRPNFLPSNDFDLFAAVANIYAFYPERTSNVFDRLKRYHPDFAGFCDVIKAKMDKMDDKEKLQYAAGLYDFKTQKCSQEVYDFFKEKTL